MTGGEIQLTSGDAALRVDVERGGRIGSWTFDGRELVVGPPAPGDASIRWGWFLMAPWAGRLADGRFRGADGGLVQLSRTHGRHAIHGLLWDQPWTVDDEAPDRAVLTCALDPGTWPPGGSVRHEIRLGLDRLDLTATVTAAPGANVAMPAAIGWHPWLRRDAGSGDPGLRVDADATLKLERMIPTGATEPVRGRTDLRGGSALGRRRLDHAYVDARPPAILAWDDLELAISWDPAPETLVVHTPPAGICVEPQTAWPNAPNLGGAARRRSGVRMLAPGESLTASMAVAITARRP